MLLAVERERAIMREMRAAARWCAERGYTGRIGDPLPPFTSIRAAGRIAAMPATFAEMVRESAR